MKRVIRNLGRLDWVRPTILVLVICHLGRFYSDAPVALAICFEHNHHAAAGHLHEAVAADHHHAHERASAPADPDRDPGFKIEHCRDNYLGMNLIPAAVLSLPAAVFTLGPDDSSSDVKALSSPRLHEPSLSIFHPPQLLS